MSEIKITEKTKPVEKKLVALEMSKEMWKELKIEAVYKELSFSALVRFILGKYLLEKDAKLDDERGDRK